MVILFCCKCGTLVEENDLFCSMCGNNIERGCKETINETKEPFLSKKGKVYITILAVLLILSVTLNVVQIICRNESNSNNKGNSYIETSQEDYDSIVNKAVTALSSKWFEIYSENEMNNGYLEIIHTRFVDINPDKDDPVFQEIERAMEIDYIIEFTLYSDYFDAAPYYHNASVYDTVVVYNDGTSMVAGNNLFRTYSNLTYSYDYSGFVTEIVDLGSRYNQQMRLG